MPLGNCYMKVFKNRVKRLKDSPTKEGEDDVRFSIRTAVEFASIEDLIELSEFLIEGYEKEALENLESEECCPACKAEEVTGDTDDKDFGLTTSTYR